MKAIRGLNRLFEKNETVHQFFKFAVTGTIAAGIDFGLFALLTRLLDLHYITANLISVFIAVIFTFIFNKFWTFRSLDKKSMHTQSVKYLVISSIAYVLQQVFLFVLVAYTPLEKVLGSLEDLGAKVISVLLVMFLNFFGNKYWTFSDTLPKSQESQGESEGENIPSQN